MSRRQAEDYTQVLNALKNSLPCVANLEEIVCDFETALWGGIRNSLPDVHIHGCYFHWAQAVFRHIGSCGLRTAYMENGPLYKILKQLLALPYLPRRHIFYAFEELRKQGQNNERVIELFNYVEATWFKPDVWGVGNWSNFKRLVRTNNDCEGWHRCFNSRAGNENLGLYTLLALIYHEADMVNLNYHFVLEHNQTMTNGKAPNFVKKSCMNYGPNTSPKISQLPSS